MTPGGHYKSGPPRGQIVADRLGVDNAPRRSKLKHQTEPAWQISKMVFLLSKPCLCWHACTHASRHFDPLGVREHAVRMARRQCRALDAHATCIRICASRQNM
jgi:hypothetical protein